jgi:hypothetical protein
VSVLTADIDGTDLSRYCRTISWRPRWNLLDSSVISFASGRFSLNPGQSEMHVYLDGDLKFSGPCWYTQAEGDADKAYTEVTGWDHRIWLTKRLCLSTTDPGNLITPGDVITDNVTAPEILGQYIQNAIDDARAASFDPSGAFGPTGPSAPLPLTLGTVDTGGDDVSGVPTSFPMSIERMRALLSGTGQLDQVLVPGIGSSELHLLNDYSNDMSGTVVFDYNTGSHNSSIATATVDLDNFWSAIWYLMGPRINEQHWRGSITPTAPHVGGTWPTPLLTRISDARLNIGYAQKIDVFDDKDDENSIRPLFEEEWANEALITAVPRTFLSIRPNRGIAPLTWGVGDLIGVNANDLGDDYSGAQHVYGFNLDQDTDLLAISELLTSADQAG